MVCSLCSDVVPLVGSLDRSGATNSTGSPDGGCIVSDGSDWQTLDACEDESRYLITLSTCCGLLCFRVNSQCH